MLHYYDTYHCCRNKKYWICSKIFSMMSVFQRLNFVQRLEVNKAVVKRNKNNPGFWTIQFTLFIIWIFWFQNNVKMPQEFQKFVHTCQCKLQAVNHCRKLEMPHYQPTSRETKKETRVSDCTVISFRKKKQLIIDRNVMNL